ncbi:TetR family transcriptional regulator [Mycobacterium avium subsp. hominissuis]|uniref:TetR/AcrR family transcriptional regulator n=1 Tax=Mycobacterium avium TaxID=1764 RepID=UPI000BB2EE78|nr:TetR/AcrR family transcriptional regulator [Mycobacterium avium]PBJ67354.1 TetR family transcriptional regulator [Mycobacterium avium subsp. hominissuis]
MTTTDPDDLTARARIRHAALREFGEKGYEGATIRSIAAAAGVSSGLLRHHFGSKQELRQACDDYLVKTMRDLNAQVQDNAKRGDVHYVSARIRLGQYQDYITRALVEGGAGELFDAKSRATLITAMALAIPLLRQHVSRGLGVDISTEQGDLRVAAILVDIYSNPLLTPEQAKSARDDLAGRLSAAAGPPGRPGRAAAAGRRPAPR